MASRVAAGRCGAGASSISFWWRRWMEHSRSPHTSAPPSPSNYDYTLRLFHAAQGLIAFADESCVLDPRAARLYFSTLDNAWSPHRAAEERRRWPALSAAGLAGTGGGA